MTTPPCESGTTGCGCIDMGECTATQDECMDNICEDLTTYNALFNRVENCGTTTQAIGIPLPMKPVPSPLPYYYYPEEDCKDLCYKYAKNNANNEADVLCTYNHKDNSCYYHDPDTLGKPGSVLQYISSTDDHDTAYVSGKYVDLKALKPCLSSVDTTKNFCQGVIDLNNSVRPENCMPLTVTLAQNGTCASMLGDNTCSYTDNLDFANTLSSTGSSCQSQPDTHCGDGSDPWDLHCVLVPNTSKYYCGYENFNKACKSDDDCNGGEPGPFACNQADEFCFLKGKQYLVQRKEDACNCDPSLNLPTEGSQACVKGNWQGEKLNTCQAPAAGANERSALIIAPQINYQGNTCGASNANLSESSCDTWVNTDTPYVQTISVDDNNTAGIDLCTAFQDDGKCWTELQAICSNTRCTEASGCKTCTPLPNVVKYYCSADNPSGDSNPAKECQKCVVGEDCNNLGDRQLFDTFWDCMVSTDYNCGGSASGGHGGWSWYDCDCGSIWGTSVCNKSDCDCKTNADKGDPDSDPTCYNTDVMSLRMSLDSRGHKTEPNQKMECRSDETGCYPACQESDCYHHNTFCPFSCAWKNYQSADKTGMTGSSCTQNSDCLSGVCDTNAGKCALALAMGKGCQNNTDCIDGLCNNGVCAQCTQDTPCRK